MRRCHDVTRGKGLQKRSQAPIIRTKDDELHLAPRICCRILFICLRLVRNQLEVDAAIGCLGKSFVRVHRGSSATCDVIVRDGLDGCVPPTYVYAPPPLLPDDN